MYPFQPFRSEAIYGAVYEQDESGSKRGFMRAGKMGSSESEGKKWAMQIRSETSLRSALCISAI